MSWYTNKDVMTKILFVYLMAGAALSVTMMYEYWPVTDAPQTVEVQNSVQADSSEDANEPEEVIASDTTNSGVTGSANIDTTRSSVDSSGQEIPVLTNGSSNTTGTSPGFSERDLLVLIFISGVLGSILHALQSLGAYMGNKSFAVSWTAWYFARPFVGGIVAYVFYVVLRGGLVPGNGASSTGAINIYGFLAVASLSGLFSSLAVKKLKQIYEAAFQVDSNDDELSDSLQDDAGDAGSDVPTPKAGNPSEKPPSGERPDQKENDH